MDKKEIVTKTAKTYGISWFSSILLAVIVGMLGYLVNTANPINGFIVGFVIVFVSEVMVLACFIPYVGIYLYWIWSLTIDHMIMGWGNISNTGILYNTLIYIPLIFTMIAGVIIFVVFSVVATVFIGVIVGAIFS